MYVENKYELHYSSSFFLSLILSVFNEKVFFDTKKG